MVAPREKGKRRKWSSQLFSEKVEEKEWEKGSRTWLVQTQN